MIRAIFLTSAIVGRLFVPSNAAAEDGEMQTDLSGEWIVVSAETEGAAVPLVNVHEKRIVFRNGEVDFETGRGVHVGEYRVGRAEDKMSIDCATRFTTGQGTRRIWHPDSARAIKGIYGMSSGKLQICFVEQCDSSLLPKVRPTDFKTRAGDNRFLLVLRRSEP